MVRAAGNGCDAADWGPLSRESSAATATKEITVEQIIIKVYCQRVERIICKIQWRDCTGSCSSANKQTHMLAHVRFSRRYKNNIFGDISACARFKYGESAKCGLLATVSQTTAGRQPKCALQKSVEAQMVPISFCMMCTRT